ncbi:MAG: hypothetical protein V4631_08975 [Pseudomonadota bacterium]
MSVLAVSADSPAIVHAAAAVLLFLHIGAGCMSLLSGTIALAARKGARLHRISGQVFVVSMLLMTSIGATVAPFLPVPERATVLAGVATFYLVYTAWAVVRRKPNSVRFFDVGMLMASLSIATTAALFIWMASNSPNGKLDAEPPQAFYIFLVIGSLAAIGDLRLLIRRGIAGKQRIARHLWRMCVAFFISAGSLFLGQQQVFPAVMRNSPLLFIPELLILALLVLWLWRVMFGTAYNRAEARTDSRAA